MKMKHDNCCTEKWLLTWKLNNILYRFWQIVKLLSYVWTQKCLCVCLWLVWPPKQNPEDNSLGWGWRPTRCRRWKLFDHLLGSRTRPWDGWQDIVWFTSRRINFLPPVFRDSTSETFNKVFARKYVKWGEVSRNAMSTLKSLEDWAGQELGVSGN